MRTIILSLALCGIAGTAQAAERLYMWPVAAAPDAYVAGNISRECGVEGILAKEIFQKVSEQFPGIEQSQSPSQDNSETFSLKVTLLGAAGYGGGGWSGSKSIAIRADILRKGAVATSHKLTRRSRGGAFGGVMGTCAIMDRIAVALGEDVAAWLPNALTSARKVAAVQPVADEKPGLEAVDQSTPNR